ncbi:STAS domain-containing protein [Halalkalibacter nanhaiisediminis]|uniref:RsbT co-antagonist protein RsbR n=1 Tax=Halalkalibacter nanhaiisediminis TaxID=688079 RepID=A0A562QTG0_9BACI|nr:STAS domain-containing protein [Halalkalibacter nanhaiisediminis]TWI60052.1 rsbT co-antagonist protein RsbR [Halalkalibacter nanhaiisediminis]
MTSIFNSAHYLSEHAESLAVEIVEGVLYTMKIDIPEREKEQAITMYIELMKSLGKSLLDGDQERVPESLIEWSKKNAEGQVSSGGNISEIVVRYPTTRDILTDLLTRISIELGLSLEENAFLIKRINAILDISLNETVFAFERLSDKFKDEAKREMAELSAPLVPIKEGIAVLPLIGEIDSYRATFILENVVPKTVELQLRYLIADFSGILNLDIEIARYLHQIGNMLRLLGIDVVVTGLRPELAQTVVNSGIDMTFFKTFANVKHALERIQ